jgi:hypothetical protein
MVTMIEIVRSRYPDIELEELYPHFPREENLRKSKPFARKVTRDHG